MEDGIEGYIEKRKRVEIELALVMSEEKHDVDLGLLIDIEAGLDSHRNWTK